MAADLTAPHSQLAAQLAPLQATLAPWVWAAVAAAALLAALLWWRQRSGLAAVALAAALLGLAVLCDIDRDERVGWEQDRFQRLSTLRADEMYYYLPEASRVRLAACGNDNLAADFMYFRSLFFIYETTDTRGSGELVYRMYSVMQELNPDWKEPQLTGPVLVSALSGEDRQLRDNRLQQAGELLERSQKRFPDDFRFLDLQANLYWGAAVDAAEEQRNTRKMIELYGQILDRFPTLYREHPELNPYLEYAPQPIRERIAALAAAEAERQAASGSNAWVVFWDAQRHGADAGVQAALAFAADRWQAYIDSRRDLRDRLLMSLNAPDYRAELMQRALAFCQVLVQELQSPVLDEQQRPGKVLEYLRWTDVFRQTGYEMLIDGFRQRLHRLPTRAEFETLAWQFQHEPGDPETAPPLPQPPAVAPGPLDPCGWAYVYEIDDSGQQFRVRSHFATVYKAALKASRLLTLIDQVRGANGAVPADLSAVHAYLVTKYPPESVLPAPILESFGTERDAVSSPCGGQFALHHGQLTVPSDVQTWLALKKAFDKQPFAEIFRATRPYAHSTPRAVEGDRLVPYP